MAGNNNNTGVFREISQDMYELLDDITSRGNDAEIRKRNDGTYDVFELEKKRRKPQKDKK